MDISNIQIDKGLKDTRPKWLQWMDRILLFGLLTFVIFAQIDGRFIHNNRLETCQGVVTNCQGDEEICNAIIKETKQLIKNQPSQIPNWKQITNSTSGKSLS